MLFLVLTWGWLFEKLPEGGSVKRVDRRFCWVGATTEISIGFQRLIPYYCYKKNLDQKKWFFMEKSWFRFSKRLKCPWFGKGLIKSLPKYLVRISYQTMVHLRRFKNLNPIISMKNQNFRSEFFSAERYGMSRWNPLKIVVWGPTPSKRRTTLFIDPPLRQLLKQPPSCIYGILYASR